MGQRAERKAEMGHLKYFLFEESHHRGTEDTEKRDSIFGLSGDDDKQKGLSLRRRANKEG